MRKTIEIVAFILISVMLGILISIPLFFFSTAEDVSIEFLNIGKVNLYKIFVITAIIVVIIYMMIRKAKDKFRQDDETRKFILGKYPPVIGHILVLFSQIIPSMVLFKGLIVIILIAFGVPRMLSFWINHNVVGSPSVEWLDNILNLMITQIIIAPISLMMLSGEHFEREKMNSVGNYSKKDDDKPITENEINGLKKSVKSSSLEDTNGTNMFIKRAVAGFIDLVFMLTIVGLCVWISYAILSSTIYSPDNFSTLISDRPINIPLNHLLVVIGIFLYFIVCIVQWRLSKSFGGTFGKIIMKLKIIDAERKNVDTKFFRREIILKTLSGFSYLGVVFFFVKKDGKMLHDYLTGTSVVSSVNIGY